MTRSEIEEKEENFLLMIWKLTKKRLFLKVN